MPVSTIEVAPPGSSYVVTIGSGLLKDVQRLIPIPRLASRAAIVTCQGQAEVFADKVAVKLRGIGLNVTTIVLPDGEASKTLRTLELCLNRFADFALGRSDFVVAVGGGVVGDISGFAAATWNRGVPIIQIPTTLLGQVDSAVGGKTGVNLRSGKNLIGAFHQPSAVIADIDTLATLPERERRAGLGEVVKYGFIADPVILEILERRPAEAISCIPAVATEIVERSVSIKARIVSVDEREMGDRLLLNYGHTLGHAIEALTNYNYFRHGEAISIGMVFAARLGERLGISEPGLADRTECILRNLGLPTGGIQLDSAKVWDLLRLDKKTQRKVRFIICQCPGRAVVIESPEPRLVEEIVASLG